MADYQAPLRDIRFLLNDVFRVQEAWQQLPELAERVDTETADAILEEAAKVAARTLSPLNRNGDEEGCRWEGGKVITPNAPGRRIPSMPKAVG